MADRQVWSVGKSPRKDVKSQYLYVTTYHEGGGATIRAVARFLRDADARLTLDMLIATLPQVEGS
jgi:hypothetical protein